MDQVDAGGRRQASVYYLAAMLEGGEDARFIARRMIVLASEDIGNADPQALLVAVAAAQAVEHVGLPEARLNLAQAAIYLARAPKSNASYTALAAATATCASTATCSRRMRSARPPTRAPRSSAAARATSTRTTTRRASRSTASPDELKGRVYYTPSRGSGEESEDPGAERARGQLDRERCRLVGPVQDRVHLDQLERVEPARLGDQLEREVRLPVGEAAAHGRPDPGREHRVDRVEIEAHVQEGASREEGERLDASTRSTPSRSTSLIVKTRTSSSPISFRSPSSSERTPTSAARRPTVRPGVGRERLPAGPSAAASGIRGRSRSASSPAG